MDWQLAIEKNREALKRILAMLVAMTGLSGSGAGDHENQRAVHTLPRHLHRLILRLLRPAEAATRRLIIIAARGLVVEPPAPRNASRRKPRPALTRKNGFGTGVVIRPGPLPEWAIALAPRRSASRSLPLFDPLKRFGARRRYVKSGATPHIRSFDDMRAPLFHQPHQPTPPTPARDDPLDTGRLTRRIEAVALALDDLPHQAKRLARWRARRDARLAQELVNPELQGVHHAARGGIEANPPNRVSIVHQGKGEPATARHTPARLFPLRPGRPPGWRRRPDHPVFEILNEVHGLATWTLELPDTS